MFSPIYCVSMRSKLCICHNRNKFGKYLVSQKTYSSYATKIDTATKDSVDGINSNPKCTGRDLFDVHCKQL